MSLNTSSLDVPGQFCHGGILFPGAINKENVGRAQMGDVPEFDVLVSSFPRSGKWAVWVLHEEFDVDSYTLNGPFG